MEEQLVVLADPWQDKYERLLEAHEKLQKLNQCLEEKLLKLAEERQAETTQLSNQIQELTQRLVEARLYIHQLEDENERYRNDINVAVQLLQCKPSNFISPKIDTLPEDLQRKVLGQRNGLGSGRKEKKIIKVQVPTFPPTDIMYAVDKGSRGKQQRNGEKDIVSAAIMAKVLEERENERKENQKNRCHCASRIVLPTLQKETQTLPTCTISYSDFPYSDDCTTILTSSNSRRGNSRISSSHSNNNNEDTMKDVRTLKQNGRYSDYSSYSSYKPGLIRETSFCHHQSTSSLLSSPTSSTASSSTHQRHSHPLSSHNNLLIGDDIPSESSSPGASSVNAVPTPNDSRTSGNLTGDSGCRLTNDSGCRITNDPGCRITNDSGCRITSEPGCRMTSDPGCRMTSDPGCRITSDPGCRMTSDPGCRMTSDSGCRMASDSGCRMTSGEPGCRLTSESGSRLPSHILPTDSTCRIGGDTRNGKLEDQSMRPLDDNNKIADDLLDGTGSSYSNGNGGNGNEAYPRISNGNYSIMSSSGSSGGNSSSYGLVNWRTTVLVQPPPRSHSNLESLSMLMSSQPPPPNNAMSYSTTNSPSSHNSPSNLDLLDSEDSLGLSSSSSSISSQLPVTLLPQLAHHLYSHNQTHQQSSSSSSSPSSGQTNTPSNGYHGMLVNNSSMNSYPSPQLTHQPHQYYRAQKRTFWTRSSSTTSTETEI